MSFNEAEHQAALKGRYNQHQDAASKRKGAGNSTVRHTTVTLPALDRANHHGQLPHQTAPGVNRNQTVQKDINKSHGVPAQGVSMFNKKATQTDLHGVTGKYRPAKG